MQVLLAATMTPSTEVSIPWENKGWSWGDNPVQRWCDVNCGNNYYARCIGWPQRVVIEFEDSKDATMFMMFYKDENQLATTK